VVPFEDEKDAHSGFVEPELRFMEAKSVAAQHPQGDDQGGYSGEDARN